MPTSANNNFPTNNYPIEGFKIKFPYDAEDY